jgi:hypothetical protein
VLPPSQPPFPLVVATLGRTEELGRFFASILDQGPIERRIEIVHPRRDKLTTSSARVVHTARLNKSLAQDLP